MPRKFFSESKVLPVLPYLTTRLGLYALNSQQRFKNGHFRSKTAIFVFVYAKEART